MALAWAGLILSCAPSPTEPHSTSGLPLPPAGPNPSPPPAPASPSPLLGTWRGVITVFAPTIQTVTWQFGGNGACLETFVTITDDGVQLTSERACTWVADSTTVTVTYMGATMPVTFTMRYSFPAADRLRLDDDEFQRVA